MKNILNVTIPELIFIKNLKIENDQSCRISLYKNQKAEVLLVKIVNSRYSARIKQLQNENRIYTALNKCITNNFKMVIPDMIDFKSMHGVSYTTRRYLLGHNISKESASSIYDIYTNVVENLNNLWLSLPDKNGTHIQTRTPMQIVLSFPFFVARCIRKHPQLIAQLTYFIYTFYKNIKIKSLISPTYTLAHRDLTPENILKNGSKYSVIDFEVGAIAEQQTDIALFPRYYYRYIPLELIIQHIKKSLTNNNDIRNFIRLSIFYTIQFLSIEDEQSVYYKEAVGYLTILKNSIIPSFDTPARAPAEIVYHAALRVIKAMHIHLKDQPASILCYHDIADSSWRFSTSPTQFEQHLKFLQKNRSVVSLSTILNKPRINQIAITFDDGYESVYTHAYPLMKKYGFVGTVFIIGDPKNRDVHALDNQFALLNTKQIKELVKNEWSIGYHSATHTILNKLNEAKLQYELVESKRLTEKALGIPIRYFAYPMGIYTLQIMQSLKREGYSHALTIDSGRIKSSEPLLTSRVAMEGNTPIEELEALLSPLGLLFSQTFISILKTKQAIGAILFKH